MTLTVDDEIWKWWLAARSFCATHRH